MDGRAGANGVLHLRRRARVATPGLVVAIVLGGALMFSAGRSARAQEASSRPAAAAAVDTADGAPAVSAAPGDLGATSDSAPITEDARAEQRLAGLLGLSIWTVVGIATGLWLALRWRRTRRG